MHKPSHSTGLVCVQTHWIVSDSQQQLMLLILCYQSICIVRFLVHILYHICFPVHLDMVIHIMQQF